jgi:hypothetical protein
MLAERAASTTASQPRVNAAGMKSMFTSQASHIVIILECVQANGTIITWLRVKLRGSGSTNRIIIVSIIGVVVVGRLCAVARLGHGSSEVLDLCMIA